jgi:hypothetical protein
VDGADDIDDNDDIDFDADASGDDSSNLSFPGTRCPICDEPTKMHKTYHLATRHFKQRLIDTLQTVVTEAGKIFRCPECGQEFKSRINLWTHYLGKHRYGEKWASELTLQAAPAAMPVAAVAPLAAVTTAAAAFKQEDVEMASAVVKAEPKVDFDEEKLKTPKKMVTSSRSTFESGKRLDFWCDLCQSLVSNSARISHFASTHFESRLRRVLPMAGAFACPLCRHEGKNFVNLSSHFLGKHVEFFKKWLREELDKLEEAAFAKMVNSDGSSNLAKHELSSGEEVETSVSLTLKNLLSYTSLSLWGSLDKTPR